MEAIKLCCPCLFGLESTLSFEIKKLGGKNLVVTDGRIIFDGDLSMIASANIWLRTAERVGIVMAEFSAHTFTELFDQTAALPWENWIGIDDKFPVKGSSLSSQLASVPDCQSIIKRAIVRRFETAYAQKQFAETGNLYQVQFTIRKDQVTLLIDTSGPGLHKRGYRANSNAAPIKETLAAGIVDLARVYDDSAVYDPMCGSGTLVIEAALKALNIAPGIRRRFTCQSWAQFQNDLFSQARKDALTQVRRDAPFVAYASDIDPEAIRLTKENAAKAGVASRIRIKQQDLADFKIPETAKKAVVLCNPPYGERMLSTAQTQALYRTMGAVYIPDGKSTYYIITADEDFEQSFGRKAAKRRKLYNGMIRCQLFMYYNEKAAR